MLKKLLCKVFGHKGPVGIPYREGKSVAAMTNVSWDCPRCGEQTSAIQIDTAKATRNHMNTIYSVDAADQSAIVFAQSNWRTMGQSIKKAVTQDVAQLEAVYGADKPPATNMTTAKATPSTSCYQPPSKEEIDARRISSQKRAQYVGQMAVQAFAPYKSLFQKRAVDLAHENSSSKVKVYKLQQMISDVRNISDTWAACKPGCSNCCYQRVVISQTEANAIGEVIGIKAIELKPSQPIKAEDEFGRTTPCTFLADSMCSIYANRPFECRNYTNVDVDTLLCSFENWDLAKQRDPASVDIPMLNAGPLAAAYESISNRKPEVYNDIRDFFPSRN